MERELHIGDVVYVDYRNNRRPEKAVIVSRDMGHFFASHPGSSGIQLDVTACLKSTAPCDPRILFPEDVEGWRDCESVEDVVEEMRRFSKRHWMHDEGQNIGIFASRIAKAVERTGDARRMRNELLNCKTLFASLALQSGEWRNAASHAVLDIQAALSASPRNCDVGTTDGQAKRFYEFCMEHQSGIEGMCSPTCPCIGDHDKCHCLCKWMQMPCEEGGAK